MKTSNFIITSSLVFVVILLFLSSTVSADIKPISQTSINYIDTNFYTAYEVVVNYSTSNNLHYAMFIDVSNNRYVITFFSSYDGFLMRNMNSYIQYRLDGTYQERYITIGSNNITGGGSSCCMYTFNAITYSNDEVNYYFLASDISPTLKFGAFSTTFNNNSVNVSIDTNFPSLYSLYQLYPPIPPTPPDNYPLLTNFYSLVIDRLSFITEEFSSNYLYTSFFVIFIIMAIIFIIKRRLL